MPQFVSPDCMMIFQHHFVWCHFRWHCIFSPLIWHKFDKICMTRFHICIHNLWSLYVKFVWWMPQFVSPDCMMKFQHHFVWCHFRWHCIFSPLIWHKFDQICIMRFQICIHNLWSLGVKFVWWMPQFASVSPDCMMKFQHHFVWYIILIKIMYRGGFPDGEGETKCADMN